MGMRSGAQAGRWLGMLDRLARAGAGMTVAELAAEFNCAPRTVYRDLAALQSRLGAALVAEPSGTADGPRWRLMDGARWRANVDVTPADMLALMAAAKLTAPLGRTPLASALPALAAKLKGRTSAQAVLFAEQTSARLAVEPPRRDYARFTGIIETVRRAMQERRTLEIRYFSFSQRAETTRRVDPWHLWWAEGGLYLVAFCHVHGGEPRTFAVERIRQARLTEDRFEERPARDWNAFAASAFGAFHGEPARVVVHFTAHAAPLVRERRWHPTQELFELPGGEVGLAMRVAGLPQVARWILSFGGDARAVEPLALVRTVRAEAAAVQKGHAHAGEARAAGARAAARRSRRG